MKKKSLGGELCLQKLKTNHLFKIMRITLLLAFISVFSLKAKDVHSQNARVTLSQLNSPLELVINEIESQTDYLFIVNSSIDTQKKVSIKVKDATVSSVLNQLLKGTNVSYSTEGSYIILSNRPIGNETILQDGKDNVISGKVVDSQGEPLPGVNVTLKGHAGIGTITDLDGNYTIKVPKLTGELVFSYIGYTPVTVSANKQFINITMEEDAKTLDEVVVTAMGIQRKSKSLTYATQKVSGEELTKVQDANFVNALQGKAAGMTITPSAGGAGGASKILLRGNKSVLGNNSPLVVIDGIPITNNTRSQAGFNDGESLEYANITEGSDPLSAINPDDIESINILKGANAAALYGSAAANGAIMITTKKGKEGKLSINVSSNITFENPLLTPEIQNVYGAAINVAAGTLALNSWGKKLSELTPEEMAYPNAHLRNESRDDVKDFFRTGVTTNTSVSLSSGTENVTTYFSYANTNANGMIKRNYFNRHIMTFRQNYTLFNKKLNVDVAINYVNSETRNRPGGGTSLNPLYDLYTTPRNIDMDYYKKNYREENATWTSNQHGYYDNNNVFTKGTVELQGPKQIWPYASKRQNNPYWLVNCNTRINYENRAYGYIAGSYEIIDGLRLQCRFSIDHTRLEDVNMRMATTWNPSQMEDRGIYGQELNTYTEMYLDGMLSYNKSFGDFSVSASVGGTLQSMKGNMQKIWTEATTFDPTMKKISTLINLFQPNASGGNFSERTYNKTSNWAKGLLFTGQVGYKEKVYLEGSYRRDWYRAFKQFANDGLSDNYGYFSAGANALLHRFFELPEVFNNLKVRASYSEVGNSIPNIMFSNIGINPSTGAITPSPYTRFENAIPEKTKSFETGFDVALFDNALELEFTYYNSSMHNSYLLIQDAGRQRPVNSGVIRNSGIETTVSYNLFDSKDFLWKTSVNFSYNNNVIVKTYRDSNGREMPTEQSIANNKLKVKYKEGGSYGDIYATDFKRDEQGNIVLTGGRPTLSDKKFEMYVGNMNAKYQLGWSNSFSYKNATLYFLIDGKIGGKVVSFTEAELDRLGSSQRTANARLAAERDPSLVWNGQPAVVMPDGNLAPIESYYSSIGGDVNATQYVYDATNFRLREVSLGYTFRNLLGMGRNVSLSFIGRNLLFLYKDAPVDPDISLSTQNGLGAFEIFNMPSTRSFGFSVKANF